MKTYVESHMKNAMSKCFLERVSEVSAACPYESYYLRQPNTGCYRTLIIFTKEGIVLTGDLSMGISASGGLVSNPGYNIDWFAGHLSEDYLCEKFLRTVWVPEKAKEYLEYMLTQDDENVSKTHKEEILIALHYEKYEDANMFYEWYTEEFEDSPDGVGLGYNRVDAGWLNAIHQRFAELYPLFKLGIENTACFNSKYLSEDLIMLEKIKECGFYVFRKNDAVEQEPNYMGGIPLSLYEALEMSNRHPAVCLLMKRAMI